MVNDGQSVKDAKQVLYDEVSANFESFLKARPADKPFCYWFGPTLVHRKWIQGSAKSCGALTGFAEGQAAGHAAGCADCA